ncbi:MAG: hypothetical protein M2R45_01937 [Verrucomicrobia subdivision 3 bacterium]|nr:hypothetical protein [Limisphaerales bacterium]MCS1416197.1 hypothetical protein [Limisphaerales bacterium]
MVRLSEGVPAIEISEEGSSGAANSTWVEVNGERIGLIGRAPADFFNVIDDTDVNLPGLGFVGGRNPENNQPLESTIPPELEQVYLLKAQGVNKIILLDHAQDFTGDPLSASELRGIVYHRCGWQHGLMVKSEPDGPFNLLRPEDSPSADYPTLPEDAEGNPVFVVDNDQMYRYVGNLIASFNAQGLITHTDERSCPIASTSEAIAEVSTELLVPTLQASDEVQAGFGALVNIPVASEGRRNDSFGAERCSGGCSNSGDKSRTVGQ